MRGGKEGVLCGSFLSAWFCLQPGLGECWGVEGGWEGLHQLPSCLPLPRTLRSFGGIAFCLPAGAVLGQAFNYTEYPCSDLLWGTLVLVKTCTGAGEAPRHF